MSDEKMCGCKYVQVMKYRDEEIKLLQQSIDFFVRQRDGIADIFIRSDRRSDELRAKYTLFEKENEELKREIEALKKSNKEQSEVYCQRNLVLSEENMKLNREIETLKESRSDLARKLVKERNDSSMEINSLKAKMERLEKMPFIAVDPACNCYSNEKVKSEPKFKVGDRVNVRNTFSYKDGEEGEIKYINGNFYFLDMPDGVIRALVEENLKKHNPPEELKIGDKVVVTYYEPPRNGEIIGHHTVNYGTDRDVWHVKLDRKYSDCFDDTVFFDKNHIEKTYEGSAIKIGDKVKVEFYGEVFDVDDDMRIDTERNVRVSFENCEKGQLYESAWLWVGNVKKIER
jgi:cell division protein FtsB